MNRSWFLLCSVMIGLLQLNLICAATLSHIVVEAEVSRVIDGDTVVVLLDGAETRVRLTAIDAPELTQPHGPFSRAHLISLTTNRTITIHSHGRDRYGRTLATLFAGDININLAMVRAGYAWRYRYARKTGPIAEAEALARAEGRGLWARDGAVAPWVFRKGEGRLPADHADGRRSETNREEEGDVERIGRGEYAAPRFAQRYPPAANRSRNSAARTYRRKVRAASFVQALAHSVPAGPVPSPPGAISARGATWRESFGGYSRRAILATSPSPSHSLYLSRRSLGEGGSAQICGHLRATLPHKKL